MKKFNIFNQRSVHFMPAIKVEYCEHIRNQKYKPDILVFDLEDSVAEDSKEKARNIFNGMLDSMSQQELDHTCRFVAVRINAVDSKHFNEDVKLLKNPKIKVIIAPKIEKPEDIKKIKQITDKPIGICLETIKGMLNANNFLGELSVENGDFVISGHEDPSADYGIERPKNLSIPNPLTHFILQTITLARGYGFLVVDGPSRFIDDLNHLRDESSLTKSWGCVAKCTIHPSQIKTINDIYNKSVDKEIANKNLEILNSLKDGTMAARNINSDMMDTPSLRMYEKIKEIDTENKKHDDL